MGEGGREAARAGGVRSEHGARRRLTLSPGHPVRGSCLSGEVGYEVTAPFRRANHCHCSRCRKHSGSAAWLQRFEERPHRR